MNYIDERVTALAKQAELDLSSVYANIEELCELNSRKVIEAVVRNRVRRQLREIIKKQVPVLKQNYNIIVVARENITTASFENLYSQIVK